MLAFLCLCVLKEINIFSFFVYHEFRLLNSISTCYFDNRCHNFVYVPKCILYGRIKNNFLLHQGRKKSISGKKDTKLKILSKVIVLQSIVNILTMVILHECELSAPFFNICLKLVLAIIVVSLN